MSTETAIIVPARLASQRFPRKLLHPVQGKPLILWTAQRIMAQAPHLPLYFAVGDAELAQVLEDAGFTAIRTDPDLPSGTDRLAAANKQVQAKVVINVQADEPLVSQEQIELLGKSLQATQADMATLATPFTEPEQFLNPNRVKVVMSHQGQALYFSRSAIPYGRDVGGQPSAAWLEQTGCYLHLGMYAYQAEFLEKFSSLTQGKLEQVEKLEQLRALENGYRIAVGIVNEEGFGIDTPADAEAFAQKVG